MSLTLAFRSRQLQESRNILHLRSLSSTPGEPHPLACDSKVLEHVVGFHDSGITYNITISGDYVAVLINTRDAGENELVVWNWHTGEKMIVGCPPSYQDRMMNEGDRFLSVMRSRLIHFFPTNTCC